MSSSRKSGFCAHFRNILQKNLKKFPATARTSQVSPGARNGGLRESTLQPHSQHPNARQVSPKLGVARVPLSHAVNIVRSLEQHAVTWELLCAHLERQKRPFGPLFVRFGTSYGRQNLDFCPDPRTSYMRNFGGPGSRCSNCCVHAK